MRRQTHAILTLSGVGLFAALSMAQMRVDGLPSFLSGITPGTGAASKALVLNSSSAITSGVSSFTASTLSTAREQLTPGGASGGSAGNQESVSNAVNSIPDNTATAILTFTVPNAAHAATGQIHLFGSLGAGGAIGANEATGTISYNIAIARTAGVATVATLSSAYGSATSAVAGANTITVSAAVSAISGDVGATQTFTVNITIARGGGSSTNHTGRAIIHLFNSNASGIQVT